MITYDESKRLLNIDQHGIDFIGCEEIFLGPTVTHEDTREDYGEVRLQTVGILSGVVVFMVHTPRGDCDHIISIRKAEKHEERDFWRTIAH
jgi:uncharacterized DUF497 family protein